MKPYKCIQNLLSCLNHMEEFQIYRCNQKSSKCGKINSSNGANILVVKVQTQSNRINTLYIYGFIYHDPPCFLTWKANDLDGHLP